MNWRERTRAERLAVAQRVAALRVLGEDEAAEQSQLAYLADLQDTAGAYERYAQTGGWVGGPAVGSRRKADIRALIEKHGRLMDPYDAARNVCGLMPSEVGI